ncbi:MAG: hypothetical protein ACRDI0_11460 [Actinomycetota bacterium]
MRNSILVIAAVLAACAPPPAGPGGGGDGVAEPVSFQRLIEDPGEFDGRRVRIESAGYYGAREISVLADAFAESHPPQVGPPENTIWVVAASPEGDCVQQAQGVTWTGPVVATGVFAHQPGGGLGHLGQWQRALEDAELTCA